MVDADEIVNAELGKEVVEMVKSDSKEIGMAVVRRRDFFHERWLKHAGFYPTWLPRLFQAGKVEVEREINEQYHTRLRTVRLQSHLDHYPFNKGLDWWYMRHVRYAKMEAQLLVDTKEHWFGVLVKIFERDAISRRAALKTLSFRLPFRNIWLWVYLYIFKRGFLDGRPGLLYISMRLSYEKMIHTFHRNLTIEKENGSP